VQVKCKKCKKTPRNCRCFQYRIEEVYTLVDGVEGKMWWLFVDNVATEPTRGEEVGTWQTRRNSKVYRRPQFVDGYGPIATITDEETLKLVEGAINDGTFFLDDFRETPGIRVAEFDRERRRRLPFLRKPRKRANEPARS
jgi:hypothetical protein